MLIYNYLLQGHEATTQNAIGAARGLDWSEIETEPNYLNMSSLSYYDTINGVEIYNQFGSDSIVFMTCEGAKN